MQEIDRSDSRRRRSETEIMLVKAEMLARHLSYDAHYFATHRRPPFPTSKNRNSASESKL